MHELSKRINDYKSLKITIKDLEQKLLDMENEIKNFMGDQEEIIVDGNTVRWKKVIQNRFDTATFSKQHSALHDQFLKQIETRRFTIT